MPFMLSPFMVFLDIPNSCTFWYLKAQTNPRTI